VIYNVLFSQDKSVLYGSVENSRHGVVAWDTKSGSEIYYAGQKDYGTFAIHEKDNLLVTAESTKDLILLFDLKTGKLKASYPIATAALSGVRIHPDGQHVIISRQNTEEFVQILNLNTKKISKFPGKMLVFRSDLSTDGSVLSLAAYFTFDWPQNPSFAVYDIGTKTDLSQFSSSLRFINLEDRKVDPLPQWTKGDRVKAKLKDQTYSGEIDQIKKDVGWILIRFDSSKPKSSDWVRPWNLEKH
jgi:hypothetical protein